MKRPLLLILMSLCLTLCWATNYRTQEYRQLQQRLCTGWNTWYNNSLVTHVCLPESFAINLCLATDDNRTYTLIHTRAGHSTFMRIAERGDSAKENTC